MLPKIVTNHFNNNNFKNILDLLPKLSDKIYKTLNYMNNTYSFSSIFQSCPIMILQWFESIQPYLFKLQTSSIYRKL